MARPIDADALKAKMYDEAFETDTDEQRWDSGCWIRYRMFERNVDAAPTIDAIPVEWLKTQINEALDDNETELASDIGWLIRKYINEQEANHEQPDTPEDQS